MENSNSLRIAKNTIALYGRSLIILAVSLYTSRVILSVLGVEDYGLYNVVGGIISMLGFLNNTMQATFQRYFNVAMGKDDDVRVLFRTSLTVQLLLALVVVVLGETIGLWFLSYKLVIPEGRMFAAQILYQITIVSFVLSVFKSPFGALIIANEKMGVYALFSVLETLLKLVIVYVLLVTHGDKLIIYSLLTMLITITDFLLYVLFCRKKIPVTSIHFNWEKNKLRGMLSFSTWATMDMLAYTLKGQGLNIVLNLFFGTVVNAARGIAAQIMNAVNQFISSFQMAFRPQLTKLYSSGDYVAAMRLYHSSTKLSFFLIFTLSLPILIETPQILYIWLGNNVPEYTVVFTRLILLTAFVSAFANPTSCVVYTAGNIKLFNIVVSTVNLMIVPVAYVFLKLGFGPSSAMAVSLVITILVQVIRLIIASRITVISLWNYTKSVVFPVVVYSALCVVAPLAINHTLSAGWLRLIVVVVMSIVSSLGFAWLVGLNSSERRLVLSKFKGLILFKR